MKILVTGSKGQLGNELQLMAANLPEHEFIFTDYQELDITSHDLVNRFVQETRPDRIINCAAYTSVDKAETEPEAAYRLNAGGPGYLAAAAASHGARMIHISSDYVFNGRNYKPYLETDAVEPAGVYAKSKALGENNVMNAAPGSIIIRTSWLYSAHGQNFVKTILRVGKEKGLLKVVADQIGSPTWAYDLANAILNLIDKNADGGIYHFSNEGVCSWYDFARTIIELSGIQCKVVPTDTAGYPLPAPRPYYSVLDKSKYAAITHCAVPWWYESLKKCLALLNEQG